MITRILIAFALIAAGLLLLIAGQPTDFRIARTAMLPAPVATVFAQVNDLHRWTAWSPWARLDPAMKVSYDGAAVGTGASHTWCGNNQVGEGRSTIIESRPNELIRIKLEFVRPVAAFHRS